MNNGLTFAFLVVLVVMCAKVAQTWIKTRDSRIKHGEDAASELEISAAKMEQLEERIRVLERIITEKNYDLKREIDSL